MPYMQKISCPVHFFPLNVDQTACFFHISLKESFFKKCCAARISPLIREADYASACRKMDASRITMEIPANTKVAMANPFFFVRIPLAAK